jgi:carbonic anhydrase/acetyltransferase-like protein (isoleucine patch superfamily)
MYKDVTIVPLNGKTPRIHPSAFIAPGCRIIGDVEIGPDVSIWYNCVIRADVNRVVIGARTNVQDGSIIHCDSPHDGAPDGYPTIIGEDCLIGHLAMVHGAILENHAFVGLSATVMNGCHIESDGMVAAGAILTPGKRVGAGQMWVGRPAKFVRDLSPADIAGHRQGVAHYVENGRAHKAAVDAL